MKPKPKVITVPNLGDKIMLDCGYGPQERYEECTIVSVFACGRLFDSGFDLCAHVRETSGIGLTATLFRCPSKI